MILIIVLAAIFVPLMVLAVVVDRRDRRSGGRSRSAADLSAMAWRHRQNYGRRRR